MNKEVKQRGWMACALVMLMVVAGCVTGDTPAEKFHSRMRADPVPPSDFLPNHELLVQQANHFPFHYFYLKEAVSAYKYVYVAPVDVSRPQASSMVAKLEKMKIEATGKNLNALADFTREAFKRAFVKAAKEAGEGACLEVVDRMDLPGTLVVEPAIIAIAPTKAELNIIGAVANFFVMGTNMAAKFLSAGSVTLECRVRDARTGEIVAMYSNTEKDPKAIVAPAKFIWTSSARINIKEIAENTAKVLSAKDYREVRRRFPIRFTALIKDANLD